MKSEGIWTEDQGAGTAADLAIMSDLRLRLQGREEQETAARTEARRLARELTVAHRLLKFTSGTSAPIRERPPSPPRPKPAAAAAEAIPPQRAMLLTDTVIFHVDSCQDQGAFTAISGWAFRPAPEWDGRSTTIRLLFRYGATVYAATASRMPRPDVAAFYAGQPISLSGGASGVDGAGFTCEILHDSLPAGVDLEITLRLECAGLACEQPTGTRLRL